MTLIGGKIRQETNKGAFVDIKILLAKVEASIKKADSLLAMIEESQLEIQDLKERVKKLEEEE